MENFTPTKLTRMFCNFYKKALVFRKTFQTKRLSLVEISFAPIADFIFSDVKILIVKKSIYLFN